MYVDEPGVLRTGVKALIGRGIAAPLALAFNLLLVKSLTISQFAAWQLGFVIITTYLVIPNTVTRPLLSRYSASKENSAPVILLNVIFCIAMTLAYITFIVNLIYQTSNVDYQSLLLMFLLIPSYYADSIILPIVSSIAPIKFGDTLTIFQVTRLVSGVILIYLLGLHVLGATLSYSIAYTSIGLYAYRNVRGKLVFRISREFFKEVREDLVKSIAFVNNIASGVIQNLYIPTIASILGSSLFIAYVEATTILTNPISWTSYLTVSLIPLLVKDKSPIHIEKGISITSLVSLWMLSNYLVLSLQFLKFLRGEYITPQTSSLLPEILIIIAITSVLNSISQIFNKIFIASDEALKRDSKSSIFKSKVMKVNNINLMVFLISYLLLMSLIVIFNIRESIEVSYLVSIFSLVTSGIIMVIYGILSRKLITFSVPWRTLLSHLLSLFVSSSISYEIGLKFFMNMRTIYYILIIGSICSVIFFAIAILTDPFTRSIAKKGVEEIKFHLKKFKI